MTILAESDKDVLAAVKAMEARDGLTISSPSKLQRGPGHDARSLDTHVMGPAAISPDAVAISWWSQPFPDRDRSGIPFLTVESLKNGIQPIWLTGYVATGSFAISSEAEIIVVSAHRTVQRSRQLLALSRRAGLTVRDLTPLLAQIELPDLESISVSGLGTSVALGSRQQVQVLDIPGEKTVYAGPGRFPRLSPDGTHLAYVNGERLYIRSLADGATNLVLPDLRVMGIGGWSPDGRFLLAGAWTRALAFEKRQIVVDTTNGHYAEIGKLGEGDYGNQFAWISTKLIMR